MVILIALYGYFGNRVDSEFRKKILAEKGQVEIILNNRISSITGILKDLASDNIIRVTVMLDDKALLQERVSEFYPSREGVYFFVKKQGDNSLVPEIYPQLSPKLLDLVQQRYPYGEILADEGKNRLVWWISAPIMHQTRLMGTAHALYDMSQDLKLINSVLQTVSGDVCIVKSDKLYSLTSGKTLWLNDNAGESIVMNLEIVPLGEKFIISKIDGFENLYFRS